MKPNLKLRVGDWVEVRSKEEILRTLDSEGKLDGMIFMPEMFQYCGQKFQVYKSAHKTCDYTTPYPYRTRRLADTVHLETRCDGHGHDDCQAGCLLYWKVQWLKPAESDSHKLVVLNANGSSGSNGAAKRCNGCSEADVLAHTKAADPNGGSPNYLCQATRVHDTTKPLAWWDIRQYVQDYLSGNVGLERLFSGLVYSSYYHLSQAGIGIGPAMRWFYNKFHFLWGGSRFPRPAIATLSSTAKRRGPIQQGAVIQSRCLIFLSGENFNLARAKSGCNRRWDMHVRVEPKGHGRLPESWSFSWPGVGLA
jgi:hypothetical protein